MCFPYVASLEAMGEFNHEIVCISHQRRGKHKESKEQAHEDEKVNKPEDK
jgi:hypothetical protein